MTPELFAIARRCGVVAITVADQGGSGNFVALAIGRDDNVRARSWDVHPTPDGALADLEKRLLAAAVSGGEPPV